MTQDARGAPGVREQAHCRYCSGGIERRPRDFWKHIRTRQARCVPGSPLNAQLADPRPGSVVVKS